MFFSVLIPVYNVESYIRESINSVLEQDEKDFEIILVDDGSTDSSGRICDEYAKQYPSTVRVIHKENEGLLLTRRCAIKHAQGEYFVHLDSDDYLMPGALKKVRQAIEEHGADLVIFKIIYGQKDNTTPETTSILPFDDGQEFYGESKARLYRQLLLKGYMTAIYQKVAHRSVVDIDGNYDKFRGVVSLAEDHLQSMPLLNNSKKAVFIDNALYYYRYNSGSITKQKSINNYIKEYYSLKMVFQEEVNYHKPFGLTDQEIQFTFARHLNSLCQRIIGIASAANSQEERQSLDPFLHDVSDDSFIRDMYCSADKRNLASVSRLSYGLVLKRHFGIFLLMVKYILPIRNRFRRGK